MRLKRARVALLTSAAIPFAVLLGTAKAQAAIDIRRFDCRAPSIERPVSLPSLSGLSISQLEKAGKANNADGRAALRVLGERYEQGHQVAKDLAKAAEYYERAAFVFPQARGTYVPGFGSVPGSVVMTGGDGPILAGDQIAIARLARMYRDGLGVKTDPGIARALESCGSTIGAADQKIQSRVSQPKLSSTMIPKADSAMLNQEIASFSLSTDVTGLAWSPDGKYLAVSHDRDRRIEFLDAQTGRRIWEIERESGSSSPDGRVLEFSADGAFLYVSTIGSARTLEGRAEVAAQISTKDGKATRTLSYAVPKQGRARAHTVSVDDENRRLLAVAGGFGNSNKVIAYEEGASAASTIVELPNEYGGIGKGFSQARLAVDHKRDRLFWSHGGMLRSFSLAGTRRVNEQQVFQVAVNAMRVDPKTGDVLVGGSANVENERYPLTGPYQGMREYRDDPAGLVRAFDVENGMLTRTFVGPGGTVYGLSVSPNGALVAAAKARMLGNSSSYILVWDAQTQALVSSKDCGQASVGDVAFDPGGTRLAFAVGRTIHITDVSPKSAKANGGQP